MKKIMRLFNLSFLFLSFTIVFVSCVKKDDYYKKDTTETNRKQVVQITGADGLIQYSRDVQPHNDTFVLVDVRRYPNTTADLNQPLTVKLVMDSSLIEGYDTTNNASFIPLPSNSYTLLSDLNAITFPAGVAIAEVKISVNQSLLDLTQQYALAFSIADPGTGAVVNPDLKNAVYSIGVKNKYDGSFNLTISTVGWGAYGIADGGSYAWGQIGLVTSGPSSVVFDYGAQVAFTTGGAAPTGFGATNPQFTFDPITDKLVNVVNLTADDGRGRAFAINPAVTDSRFDASTKTIYAAYLMFQKTRPTQYIYDTLTFVQPR